MQPTYAVMWRWPALHLLTPRELEHVLGGMTEWGRASFVACICSSSVPYLHVPLCEVYIGKKSGNSPIERESFEAFVEPWFFHAMVTRKRK